MDQFGFNLFHWIKTPRFLQHPRPGRTSPVILTTFSFIIEVSTQLSHQQSQETYREGISTMAFSFDGVRRKKCTEKKWFRFKMVILFDMVMNTSPKKRKKSPENTNPKQLSKKSGFFTHPLFGGDFPTLHTCCAKVFHSFCRLMKHILPLYPLVWKPEHVSTPNSGLF